MTSEAVVINKEGVALAADSAVTMGEGMKTWQCANKIFALSKYYPVGIMVYGSSKFMGVPWETLIKIFRFQLPKDELEYITDYASRFIEFLSKIEGMIEYTEIENYVLELTESYFMVIRDEINHGIDEFFETNETATQDMSTLEEVVEELMIDILDKHLEKWVSSGYIDNCSENDIDFIVEKCGSKIDLLSIHIFENVRNLKAKMEKLRKLAGCLYAKNYSISPLAGFVITGFGAREIFPSLQYFEVEGVVKGSLKYRPSTWYRIPRDFAGHVFAFAQDDMVKTFTDGLDPIYIKKIKEFLDDSITDIISNLSKTVKHEPERVRDSTSVDIKNSLLDLRKEVISKLEIFKKEKFRDKVAEVVAALPRTELAAMAESLVNLTSMKGKVSPMKETVGGPIDVVVISKGDGFIWIERKHYFAPELNPSFIAKYYRRNKE